MVWRHAGLLTWGWRGCWLPCGTWRLVRPGGHHALGAQLRHSAPAAPPPGVPGRRELRRVPREGRAGRAARVHVAATARAAGLAAAGAAEAVPAEAVPHPRAVARPTLGAAAPPLLARVARPAPACALRATRSRS